jgi:ribosomal protein S17E
MSAYNNHGDIVLCPDDIWIQIMLFFSNYVNTNAEILRDKIVYHSGKKNLIVREYADDVENSLKVEEQWDDFFNQIIKQISNNTNEDFVQQIQCDFTTTTQLYKIVSTAIIMNGLQSYFNYGRLILACAINNIYFMGIRSDWEKLITKTISLRQYDTNGVLTNYVDHIIVILQKLLDTFDNKVDVSFWNNVMATETMRIGSGKQTQTKINGWIIHFFGKYQQIDLNDIPNFNIAVPVEIHNTFTNTTKQLELTVDWCSVSREDDYIYRPNLSLDIVVN